jgi:hypothetical protein
VRFFWNIIYLAAMVGVVAAFETGLLLAGDAFFLASAIVAVFTGHRAVASGHPAEAGASGVGVWVSSAAAYAGCLALGALVTVQAISQI